MKLALLDQKKELRRVYRLRRESINVSLKARWEQEIIHRLEVLFGQLSLRKVAGYRAFGSEVSLEKLYQKKDLSYSFPQIEGDGMRFLTPKVPNTFVKNIFKIDEPDPESSEEVLLSELQAVLIPGLVFDRRGYRLGYGKGFYDKALVQYTGFKIGIAFKNQIENKELPVEDHDLPMDFVVTEDFILNPLAA